MLGEGGGLKGKRLGLRRLCRRMVGREEKKEEMRDCKEENREEEESTCTGTGEGQRKGPRGTKAKKVSGTGSLPAGYTQFKSSLFRQKMGPRAR